MAKQYPSAMPRGKHRAEEKRHVTSIKVNIVSTPILMVCDRPSNVNLALHLCEHEGIIPTNQDLISSC
ncbi:hypothetical protein EUGRSUZ_K03530 [Eucalyptus grandis]|uniref:Uncharacterized protein n=2 Tax=Eucalyptus grandis TaxID=71139 RepID=A0ACC3J0H2_EUCGR|nr:hypothetical protein EUGRSUZ_K03530 [Eucalyptus grandis]